MFRLAGPRPLEAGPHSVTVAYDLGADGGTLTLTVDGEPAGSLPVTESLPLRWQIGGAGLLVGRSEGFPVEDGYRPPFPFTGTIERVRLEVPALMPPDPRTEIETALRHE